MRTCSRGVVRSTRKHFARRHQPATPEEVPPPSRENRPAHSGTTQSCKRWRPDKASLLRALWAVSGIPPKDRTRIHRNEKVPLELNDRERKLIQWHTFADGTLTDRLRVVPKPGEPQSFTLPWMIWMNSRASLRPKPTTPRIRNYRRSWTSSATAFKLLWTATRTRTIDSNSPFYGPCRTSTLAIPAHQSSAPVYMERWVHRTNTKDPVVVIHTRVNCAGYEIRASGRQGPRLHAVNVCSGCPPFCPLCPLIPQEDTFRRGHKGRSSLLTITSSLSPDS